MPADRLDQALAMRGYITRTQPLAESVPTNEPSNSPTTDRPRLARRRDVDAANTTPSMSAQLMSKPTRPCPC